MTHFENFKAMNIDKFAEWIDKYGQFDNSPWMTWFDEKYCSKCEPIMCHYEGSSREFPCSYCEIEDECKFFPEMPYVPDGKDIVKMWLESEVEE